MGKSPNQMLEVNKGVHHGDLQCSSWRQLLFNISLGEAVQKVKNSNVGMRLESKLNILAFADDVV